jgi:2-methylisocitrate lyase-like PEP mutase family enzyme
MSRARERFHRVISGPTCVLAANIFDPLSARIADMLGYEVCVLSGSVGKAANWGVRISCCLTCPMSWIIADALPVWLR